MPNANSTWADALVTWEEATFTWAPYSGATMWADAQLTWDEATFPWEDGTPVVPVVGSPVPRPWLHRSLHPGQR